MAKLTVTEILLFLNSEKVRATYGAVGDCIGLIAQGVSRELGARCPEASWVVNTEGHPTGYETDEMHPDLFGSPYVITTCKELHERVIDWRNRSRSATK